VRCPRCRRETADPAPAFCTECGAPLKLRDDPAPRALEASVAIDRRLPGAGAEDDTFAGFTPAGLVAGAAATAAPALDGGPPGDLPALDRSSWDLSSSVPHARRDPARELAAVASAAPPGDSDLEVDALEIHLRRPETWRRAAAGAIDVVPFAAGGIALARWLVRAASVGLPAPATGLDGFLDLLARERVIVLSVAAAAALALAVYTTLAHALAGATLGKRLLGLRLVGPDGARPTLARSVVRTALVGLSAALLGLGVLLALFTRSGRALHDLLARTWVVEAP
jgi:uncharacterized RDD family membrane protein YckC